jgi:signal transduction histidine kinase/ActR/RegA family two-component response regulator
MQADDVDFRQLFESVPGLYLVLSPDLKIVAASDAYLQATMTRRDDILGRSLFEVFPDNPRDPGATGVRNLTASLARVLATGQPDAMAVQKYDVRRPRSEAFEERYWSPVNTPVPGPGGEVAFIIHRVEDVTDFIRLRQRGAEQEEVAHALRTRGEQMESEIFLRAQQLQEANRRLREVQAELERRVEERTAELAAANAALRAEMEQGRRLEEQFRQAQKLEAIGTLAGGVAHDFNNLLTVISGCTEILRAQRGLDGPAHALVEEIHHAGERAASLTRQLLAFSRQQVLRMDVLDLNAVVSGVATMLARLIGEDIRLATVLGPQIGRVRADAGQIEQIILNLAVNARDAMPQGGRLTLETADVVLDEAYAQGHMEVQPGRYVSLAISDTGCGMDKATQARIFEPFFTTKGQGKGTGLGLATVFGIVKQSGGHIWVYSEPGHGSTFRILLPVVEAGARTAPAPAARAAAPSGTETVLVVEDDAAVRAISVYALEASGYAVLQAGAGRDALRVVAEHDGPLHLLISDVIMPDMGGRMVADAVRARRPGTRVLFLSGYTDDAVVRHGVLHEEVAFLQKPFTLDALARKVREVLDGGGAGRS